jgi:hypothetical protein
MTNPFPAGTKILGACLLILTFATRLPAQTSVLNAVGFTVLNSVTTNLNGSGVRVAQVEADYSTNGQFEVNPGAAYFSGARFKYISTASTATSFPNSIGTESPHADLVGQVFYGLTTGLATNVAHVDNYEVGGFLSVTETSLLLTTNYTATLPDSDIADPVVNQSFIFETSNTNLQKAIDTAYDNYAVQYNTLFVSAIGNSGPVSPPATCYNGLGVGAYGGISSYGPTLDNGRAKPDLVGPAQETSFAAPLVAGAAAVLIQAGLQGNGGTDTNSAVSICTLRALLINGAIKPVGWTNISPSPLDANYGAGVLNLFESYEQLTGGKHGYTVAASVTRGAAHPPTEATGTEPVLSGWDFNTNTSAAGDEINHYYFNVTNGAAGAHFTTTATLAWNRHQNQTAINNLSLFLYNTANSNLLASSISTVDNMQQVWVPRLPAGRYDLQVWKSGANTVSAAEPYALAFEFVDSSLAVTKTGTNVTLSWPVYPAGFLLAASSSLLTPFALWNTNFTTPVITNAQNQIILETSNLVDFFQLTRP